MLLTNHVLSGALIGALARRPLPAFAAGVASHFALDAVPHWAERDWRDNPRRFLRVAVPHWAERDWRDNPRRFLRVAVPDGLAGLAALCALAAAAPPPRRRAVLAGMAGAALPDADKPARLWFGRSPWPDLVDRFHDGIQREAPGRGRYELLAAGVLAAAALLTVRAGHRAGG
jgi:hypothetical protein